MSGGRLRVAIVGGGITGLAAAYAIEQQSGPTDVTLLEASDRVGGKIQTDYIGSVVVERGPDAMFLRNPFALEVIEQLGLGDDVVRANPAHREATILRDGQLHPLPDGMESGVPRSILPMATTRLLSPWGKLRAAAELTLPRSVRDGGDESVDGFVRRRFGDEVADRIAAPLLGGIYSSDIRELSLMATAPHLRKWEEEHGSLLLASLRERLPGALPRSRPAASPFMSLRSGLSTLVEGLRSRLVRTQLRLRARVAALATATGGEGFVLTLADGAEVSAERLILTTPAFATAELLEPLSAAAAARLREIHYASTTVVALVFGPEARSQIPRGSGFLVDPSEPSALKACSWTSQKWPHCTPDGELLVRCHVRPEIMSLDDATLVHTVRRELRERVVLRAEPIATRVYAWPRSVPSYSVGHLERVHAIESSLAEFPGLVVAGASMRGVGVPECLRQGVAAAEQVTRRSAHTDYLRA